MTTAIQRHLPRTLLAASLALASTVASFAFTTSPAYAADARNRATLTAPLEAPAKKVVGEALWRCEGASCSGINDGARALNTCVKVVKAFGPVSSFASPKGELSAEELSRCNAAA